MNLAASSSVALSVVMRYAALGVLALGSYNCAQCVLYCIVLYSCAECFEVSEYPSVRPFIGR